MRRVPGATLGALEFELIAAGRSAMVRVMNQQTGAAAPSAPLRLVLASTSRARSTLLTQAGIEHRMEASGVDEARFDAATPEALVSALAEAKAQAVAARATDAIVLGCDSVLGIDGRVLGKPATPQAAREHWNLIAGRTATLSTGHTLLEVRQGAVAARAAGVAHTEVRFARPSPAELDAYVASGEPLASAGAFTLEGLSAPFIEGVSGSPSNVIGLSLPLLAGLLRELGLSIVQFWKSRG
jgi:septum formation protein